MEYISIYSNIRIPQKKVTTLLLYVVAYTNNMYTQIHIIHISSKQVAGAGNVLVSLQVDYSTFSTYFKNNSFRRLKELFLFLFPYIHIPHKIAPYLQ
jgi:hypothetical protein